jgi:Sigma-54 interaction domain/FHA domain/Bacterial regulatory protein, Fis family
MADASSSVSQVEDSQLTTRVVWQKRAVEIREAPTVPTAPSIADPFQSRQLVLQWLYPEERRAVPLSGTKVQIGRGSDCDIALEGPGVSRRHAELYRQGPLWVLRDCGSTNGTFLQGRAATHEPISADSVLRIGSHVGAFVYVMDSSEADLFHEVSPGFCVGNVAHHHISPALRAARSRIPIAISGETGTGKERIAQAIHHHSGRAGVFVGVNCAAIPEHLAESQLFGHVKGSFTGATHSSLGYLRAASGGTLFLDEVADLPLPLQGKLLRAIQEQEVIPVGSQSAVSIDLRLVSAAQKPFEEYVKMGVLREDLKMRIDGLSVRAPALRERIVEIPRLFSLFVQRAAGTSAIPSAEPKLIEALCIAPWPGNVRQLELVAQRLVALSEPGRPLGKKDLPIEFALSADSTPPPRFPTVDRAAHDVERLRQAMRATSGNLTAASRLLNISRQRAYRLLGEHAPDLLEARGRGETPADDWLGIRPWRVNNFPAPQFAGKCSLAERHALRGSLFWLRLGDRGAFVTM